MTEQALKNRPKDPRDKWIPRYFVIFFAVIALLDGIFVYIAVSTQTGMVVKDPYKKGLAFNETLEKAKKQPMLENKVSYKDGTLRWVLPIENASVTANIKRPVQEGYDFKITFTHTGSGVYEARPKIPLPGAWRANLSAKWGAEQFQASHDFIAK